MDTNDKEAIGEVALKQNNIFDTFFPGNLGYRKITDKKLQLAGVDYEVFLHNGNTVNIDLKVGIGYDYSMKSQDYIKPQRIIGRVPAVAVEISQYGEFTNTKGKLTDYFLYYIKDNFQEVFYLFSYADIRRISLKNDEYTKYTSFNGTGIYIKIPAEKFAIRSYYVQ